MTRFSHKILSFIAALAPFAGCAQTSAPVSLVSEPGAIAPVTYTLTASEQKLSCAALRGRMQVAILDLRAREKHGGGSMLAEGMQYVTVSVFGGPKTGFDPDAEAARQRDRLAAYNDRLKHLKCRTYDLTRELDPEPTPLTSGS